MVATPGRPASLAPAATAAPSSPPSAPKNNPDPIVEALVNAKDAKGIEALQRKLVATGHYPELAEALAKGDGGRFGKLTKLALQQHFQGNPPNDATKAVIAEGAQRALKELNVGCPPQDRNPRVFLIQAANDLVINPRSPIGMDGIYGPKTKKLVENGEFRGRVLHELMQMSGTSATAATPVEIVTTRQPPDAMALETARRYSRFGQ